MQNPCWYHGLYGVQHGPECGKRHSVLTPKVRVSVAIRGAGGMASRAAQAAEAAEKSQRKTAPERFVNETTAARLRRALIDIECPHRRMFGRELPPCPDRDTCDRKSAIARAKRAAELEPRKVTVIAGF